MMQSTLVMNALAEQLVAPHLPEWVDARYFRTTEELMEMAPEAEIGWFDLHQKDKMVEAMELAKKLRWLNSIYAGLDGFPLDLLRERQVIVTNGAGINAITIAEYVVMNMLTFAKGYRDVVRAQDRHEWLRDSPGKGELSGSRALVLGAGAIGHRVARMLGGFDVDVTTVRRTPGPHDLGPDQWRARLGEFDWVILAVPSTPETATMIGAAELASMKPSGVLINVARGEVVDQPVLVDALKDKRIGGAILDVTTPEPLPADHVLWTLPNAHVTMHLSGRAQDRMFQRGVARFLDNLPRFRAGKPLEAQVDLALGY